MWENPANDLPERTWRKGPEEALMKQKWKVEISVDPNILFVFVRKNNSIGEQSRSNSNIL
jgi:hypothetical protein